MVNAEMGDYWLNITQPCIMSNSESQQITNEKYCISCYREILTNVIMNDKIDDEERPEWDWLKKK